MLNKLAIVLVVLVLFCSEIQSSKSTCQIKGVSQNILLKDQIPYHSIERNLTEAPYKRAQHHVSIRLKDQHRNFAKGHLCSGVVISPSAVLTSAQCVYNYGENKPYHPSELKVVLASRTLYQKSEQALVFSVTHSHLSEQFNALNLSNNLAILLLERDIPKTHQYVKPITFTTTKLEDSNGDELKVTTWLKTSEGLYLNYLMQLNVSQVSNKTCLEYYGESIFSSGMLCIKSYEPLSQTVVDSGSPLFVDNVLVGVKSFSSGHLSPAIYTDVSHHAQWIHSVIGDGSNQNSSIWGILGFLLLTLVTLKRTTLRRKFY